MIKICRKDSAVVQPSAAGNLYYIRASWFTEAWTGANCRSPSYLREGSISPGGIYRIFTGIEYPDQSILSTLRTSSALWNASFSRIIRTEMNEGTRELIVYIETKLGGRLNLADPCLEFHSVPVDTQLADSLIPDPSFASSAPATVNVVAHPPQRPHSAPPAAAAE